MLERSWPLAEAWNQRSFQTSPVAGEEIKIEVPNMGDSISEGTIAGIERKAGALASTLFGDQYRVSNALVCIPS